MGFYISYDVGYVGEYNARQIQIDIKAENEKWPSATATLTYCRPLEDDWYIPSTYSKNGNTIVWTPDATDTNIEGTGQIQVVFRNSAGTLLGKTRIMNVSVYPSGQEPGTEPEKMQYLLDDIVSAKNYLDSNYLQIANKLSTIEIATDSEASSYLGGD